MPLRLLKLTWTALRHGRVFDEPVTRNPIAWIPFFLALPFVLLLWLLIAIGYVVVSPVLFFWGYLASRSLARKAGVFSEQGIHFPKGRGRITIAWSEILEVVYERPPKVGFYRIVCGFGAQPTQEYILTCTPDNEAFERTLRELNIPFRGR
jgi:hypothetical protein